MSDDMDSRVLGVMAELIVSDMEDSAKVVQELWKENVRMREALELELRHARREIGAAPGADAIVRLSAALQPKEPS